MSLDLKLEEFFDGKVNLEGLLCRREIEYSSYEHIKDIVNDCEDKSDNYRYKGSDASKFSTQFSYTHSPLFSVGYYRRHLNNQTSLTIHNTGLLTFGMFQMSYPVLSAKYKTVSGEIHNPHTNIRKFVNNTAYVYPTKLKNTGVKKCEITF